jgi:hypothetical protein
MEASAGIVRKIGDRAAIVGRSRKPEGRQRSKISNGNKLTAGVDGRSLWVRRLKDLIADGISDLGIDNTSATSCGAPNFLGNSLTGCAGLKGCFSPFLGRLLVCCWTRYHACNGKSLRTDVSTCPHAFCCRLNGG